MKTWISLPSVVILDCDAKRRRCASAKLFQYSPQFLAEIRLSACDGLENAKLASNNNEQKEALNTSFDPDSVQKYLLFRWKTITK